ncbi:MAG: helix-turn-helix transcriptional regulator [Kocuria sp.]|nr:helix-turn-helix transcriptional regulator [Kocuria sp.]
MNPLPGDLFARRLRQERERLGISQAELARRIAEILGTNVDPSAVTRIEQQIRAVRLDEAVAAAQALDVPLTVLVADDPEAETEAQLQQYLAELAVAQREWEKSRLEVLRISKAIQVISGGAHLPEVVDPRLLESIDARVPLEDDASDGESSEGPTAPGA